MTAIYKHDKKQIPRTGNIKKLQTCLFYFILSFMCTFTNTSEN